jgi:endonuclease VIII
MPEGPSIVILREETARFVGNVVRHAAGNAKIEMQRIDGRRIEAIHSFGKQFLMALPETTIRIHLMMFGTYRINDTKDASPRLQLDFDNGQLNFYSCSVRLLEGSPDELFDWRIDVMSEQWDAALARAKLKKLPSALVCDALLNQDIFAGVGNIIKNEVLYRIRVHPLSLVGALPTRKLNELIKQAREYSLEFLDWKRTHVLSKHWQVYNQSRCPRHDIPLKRANLGKGQRRTFYCDKCQKIYV